MAKATHAQKEERLNTIYTLLVNGATRYDILQYSAKHFGLKTRQVDNYIGDANALIASEAEYHRSREIGRSIARLHEVFKSCMGVKDYRSAIAAQRELNALLSLYEPPAVQRIELLGLDLAQLQVFADMVRRTLKGSPSEALEAYIRELAEIEHEADHHDHT